MNLKKYCQPLHMAGLFCFLFAIIVGVEKASCQPSLVPHTPLLDTAIMKMDLSRVPTKLIEDFAETPINFDAFSGITALCDSNYVNFGTLNGILSGLVSSQVDNTLSIPEDITAQMSLQYTPGLNPVGIVAYKYSRTKEHAVADSLFRIRSHRLYDAFDNNGNWLNPYEDKYVVAFSPYVNVAGNTATYSFRSDLRFSNLSVSSIEFNPGDGNGYRTIDLGNTNVQVSYSSPVNPVELKLRINLTGGQTLESHSYVNVFSPAGSSSNSITLDNYQYFSCDSTYLGYTEPVMGKMSVKFAPGHTSLIKPLIVAEGFDPFSDPDGVLGGNGLGEGMNSIDGFYGLTSVYDVVYVDWLNSCAPIQANAEILKKVINWVNANKTSTEKNVLLGQSMGGLIARYAIRTMELAGLPHDVKVYVSDDAPHFGVNVPSGYLFILQKLLGKYSLPNNPLLQDIITSIIHNKANVNITHPNIYIDELYNIRTAPSVRQMLMHYVSPDLAYNSQMYNDFQNTLNTIGFPKGDSGAKIINLSISNGGPNNFVSRYLHLDAGVYNGLLGPLYGWLWGTLFDDFVTGLLGTVTFFSGPRIQLNVNPNYPGTTKVFEYSLTMTKFRGLNSGEMRSLENASFNAPTNSVVYDSDAGSYYQLPFPDLNIHEGDFNVWLGGYAFEATSNNRFMFVPSVSSLAFKRSVENITPADRTTNFAATGLDMEKIPFDGYKFVPDSLGNIAATYHTRLSSAEIAWIDDVQSLSISATPDTLADGYQLQINIPNLPVSWSLDSLHVASIDESSGVLTRILGGTATAYADVTYNGGHYRLSKSFCMEGIAFPGFPTYVMSATPSLTNVDGIDYLIRISASNTPDSLFAQYMTAHIGIKEDNNSQIVWSDVPYTPVFGWSHFSCNFPDSANARMVYFKVSFFNQESPTYSVFCRRTIPQNPFLLMGNDGSLYSEDTGESFAQVKGEVHHEVFYLTCMGTTLTYDSWPSWSDFCSEMLNNELFIAQIKSLRPWGQENIIMIPYSYHTSIQEREEHGFITVKFDKDL